MYDLTIAEEELKNKVATDFFGDFDSTERPNNIDFVVAQKYTLTQNNQSNEKQYLLWAEAKRGNKSDIIESFIQLILTIGKAKLHDSHIPPQFLGAFDAEKFAFVEFSEVAHIFSQNDFNWSVTPSNHDSKEFKQLYALIGEVLENENLLFSYDSQDDELREFIEQNFESESQGTQKIKINKNNFFGIYLKWLDCVKPTISVDWEAEKPEILDSDFYLADLLSRNNSTTEIYQNLRILLQSDYYEVKLERRGRHLNFTKFSFKDSQRAHRDFWSIYERPPKEEFWDYIIERRDLLVPQDIRERKGAFFTPQIWVQKAQEYLAESLGENWQDEYYIWDCAAGTGNLLAGLINARNIYASTIDRADVDVMQERRLNGANLLETHIFQFDFLNDCFFDKVDEKSGKILVESKLPKSLQEIIKNEPQKLVIFINPPYAEAATKRTIAHTGQNKDGVSNTTQVYKQYSPLIGTATRELFAQFFIRIYKEIPNCILGSFSTLKYINAQYYNKFKKEFKAKFLKGFIIPAWTFDNVKGDFPIGFLVWNLGEKIDIKKCKVDIFNENNKKIGKKSFYNIPKNKYIIDWLKNFHDKQGEKLVYLRMQGTDMQHNNGIFIANDLSPNDFKKHLFSIITKYNLIPFCVYFAVRHAIRASWINDRDQFLYPKNKWRFDKEFHNNCLAFTLFHNQNRISASEGTNHFIPFSEVEVGAKGRFESDFMVRFINGKVKNGELDDCFIPSQKIAFSKEAEAVFGAGLEIWRYYHKCAKNSDSYLNDASLYDIKEFFQGRGESINGKKGKMNAKSTDSHYNDLIALLRIALQNLADKITPKIYEYEFLRE